MRAQHRLGANARIGTAQFREHLSGKDHGMAVAPLVSCAHDRSAARAENRGQAGNRFGSDERRVDGHDHDSRNPRTICFTQTGDH